MADLKTLTVDGVSMDNFHPATSYWTQETFSLTSGSIQLWVTDISIPKGLSFINGTLVFPANSTGSRYFQFGTYNGSTFSSVASMRTPACPSGQTFLFGSGSVNSGNSSNFTLACKIYQNSGSTQTVTGNFSMRTFPTLVSE